MQPVIYSLTTTETERGITLIIAPPRYTEVVAQREHMQPDRWMLGVKQKDRIATAVMEERAIFITMHTQRQADNVIRWFQAEFGGED